MSSAACTGAAVLGTLGSVAGGASGAAAGTGVVAAARMPRRTSICASLASIDASLESTSDDASMDACAGARMTGSAATDAPFTASPDAGCTSVVAEDRDCDRPISTPTPAPAVPRNNAAKGPPSMPPRTAPAMMPIQTQNAIFALSPFLCQALAAIAPERQHRRVQALVVDAPRRDRRTGDERDAREDAA